MFSFTLSQHNKFATLASRKSAVCAGYWLETNPTVGSNSIEQDPMQMASFYKESGN